MLFRQSEAGKHNWANKIKQVLTVNGFGIAWLCQDVGNKKLFISEFKDRLISCYKQNWHSNIQEHEKYVWFSSFKSIFQPEMFLKAITNKFHRSMLARFRCRTLGLKASKRWYNVERTEDDLCEMCTEGVREDENHFMFYCNAYQNIRNRTQLFENFNARNHNLPGLLQSKDNDLIVMLAEYISEAVNVRKKKMEEEN